jgi:hypothetical protein
MKLTTPLFLIALAFGASNHASAAASAPAATDYPLTTCVVSGDKLGEMGPAVHYTYQEAGKPDRELQFCCKDCIADFKKDPAKYLAVYDAAVAHKTAGVTVADKAAAGGKCSGCAEGGNDCCTVVLMHYTPVATALAADDLPKAKSAASVLAKVSGSVEQTDIAAAANAVAAANDLTAARDAFKTLSAKVEPLTKHAKGYVVLTCPMAKADWVQTDANVRNPYFGKAMSSCGMVKE